MSLSISPVASSLSPAAAVLPSGLLLFLPLTHQPVLLKALLFGPAPLQHYIPQNIFPDIVGGTSAADALVLGADIESP